MRTYWYKFGKPHDWLIHGITYHHLIEALRNRQQHTVLFIYEWNHGLIDVLDCTEVLRIGPGENYCTCPSCRQTYEARALKDIQGMLDDVT